MKKKDVAKKVARWRETVLMVALEERSGVVDIPAQFGFFDKLEVSRM